MDLLPAQPLEVIGLILSYVGFDERFLCLRTVNKRWERTLNDCIPVLLKEMKTHKLRIYSQKQTISHLSLEWIQTFELQMHELYMCQSRVEVFSAQDISNLTRDAVLSLCGLYYIFNNRSTSPGTSQLKELARYTKCPLFYNRLADTSPSDMLPETLSTLKVLIEDADFLRLKDGLPSLSNAIANWVSMFFSYAQTTKTVKRLSEQTTRLKHKEEVLDKLMRWMEGRRKRTRDEDLN